MWGARSCQGAMAENRGAGTDWLARCVGGLLLTKSLQGETAATTFCPLPLVIQLG